MLFSVDGSAGDPDRDGSEHRHVGDGHHRVRVAGRGPQGLPPSLRCRHRARHVQLAHRSVCLCVPLCLSIFFVQCNNSTLYKIHAISG